MTDLREAYVKRYISRMPSYNSIINYFDSEELTPYLKMLLVQSALPLKILETDFAGDASGLSSSRYISWISAKNGKKINARDWLKIHILCGIKTHIVTSAEITAAYVGDSTQFAALVDATAKRFNVSRISADKAYSSRTNLRLVEQIGAKPYIPFKKNAKPDGRNDAWNRMYHLYQMERKEFYAHYNKRSNVESTFSMIKARFGGNLRCRTFTAQANEALCKIVSHNLCCLVYSAHELDAEMTVWGDQAETEVIGLSPIKGEAQLTLF
jgi:transposase